MELSLVILGIVLVLLLNAAVWLLLRGRGGGAADGQTVLLLQQQVQELSRVIDGRLSETSRSMQESMHLQFSESQKLVQAINRQMSDQLLDAKKSSIESLEASKQVLAVTEQLQNLEKVLKHQKQRGTLGEAGLTLILENMLPPTAFKLQYQFPDGETVDAAIFTKDGIIPVDAKFSLDNYNRLIAETDEERRADRERDFKQDLKRRIDETAKYIKPKDGTLPFAFMFIPAEGIYYDLLVNEVGAVKVNTRSLIDYAYRDRNVIIVSPTTFAAYLQSVLYGFRAFQIEEQAKDIVKNVEMLMRHLAAYDDYYKKLGNALNTAFNQYTNGAKEFKKIDKDIFRITGHAADLEPLSLDRPEFPE